MSYQENQENIENGEIQENIENGELIRIYKISSDSGPKCYIGSTKQKLSRRFTDHKTSRHYATSLLLFREYGKENCKIELLEEKTVKNKLERCILEQRYLNLHSETMVNKKSTLNKKMKKLYGDLLN